MWSLYLLLSNQTRIILFFFTKGLKDEDMEDNYYKSGFEHEIRKELMNDTIKQKDTDLDDEQYRDQLKTFIRRITPPEKGTEIIKRTDQETIWDRIHGTDPNYTATVPAIKRNKPINKSITKMPRNGNGIFGDSMIIGGKSSNSNLPKIFRQSVVTRTILKPDGTYETRKTVTDADGNAVTTITKTLEGQTKTYSFSENSKEENVTKSSPYDERKNKFFLPCDRNIFVTKSGYALPNIF